MLRMSWKSEKCKVFLRYSRTVNTRNGYRAIFYLFSHNYGNVSTIMTKFDKQLFIDVIVQFTRLSFHWP